MLKIALPVNMEGTTFKHFEAAERPITIDYVHISEDDGVKTIIGRVEKTGDWITTVRSFDIPFLVEDPLDVGICGSDAVREKELELGIKLEELNDYTYGRVFTARPPTLDLIARGGAPINSYEQLKPGSMILTEYPKLTREFLENNGFNNIAEFTRTRRAPLHPDKFRKWCADNEKIGLTVVHGRIAELVNIGAGYGVMVNETGETARKYNLKVLGTIHEIRTLLIADQEAVRDKVKGPEVESLQMDLDRGYLRIYGESEAAVQMFKERL